MSNGKGSKPRPVDKKKFDKNYDSIDWSSDKKRAPEVKKSPKKK